jgi:hypothetical protein
MIDFALIHHHSTYQYGILLVVASFTSFPWVGIEISATSTQVALLIKTDMFLSVACVLAAEISMRNLGEKQ